MQKNNRTFTLVLAVVLLALIPFSQSLVHDIQLIRSNASSDVQTATFTVTGAKDIANQDGMAVTSGQFTWIGDGKDVTKSYTGILFHGNPLPALAQIQSATLTVTPNRTQWIPVSVEIFGENSVSPLSFSSVNPPSARVFTNTSQIFSGNVKWVKNTKYTIDISSALKALTLTQSTNTVSIVMAGRGGAYARKFIYSTGANAPTLTLTYTLPSSTANTPTPTSPMVTSMPSTMPNPTGSRTSGANSAAMGLWTPNPKFDTCPTYPSSSDLNHDGTVDASEKIAYIKSIHDSYKVKGPDGKWYPTWHPPVDPATGCKFGHEHGQDPSKSSIWAEVKDHYAYVNPDGTKDLAHAGIPFAYVNEQMDTWTAANGNTIPMRHEDHVGHKVAIANNFQIGLNKIDGGAQFFYPGVTCNYIVKVHQGTHSKDAFENNLHEILYNAHCSDGHRINFDTMGKFGKPGEFTRSCDSAGDRTSIIKTGFDYSNSSYPGSDESVGTRGISDRSCIETGFLVPQGTFSQNPYEFWPVVITMTKKDGSPLVDWLNLLFDVEDSIRYYYPGHKDPTTGVTDNLGHMQDLCYENLNGRTFRGNLCDGSTNFGAIQGITWDDPRAGFKDLNRGTYFKPGATHNAGGQNVWYTDPFGNNAQNTPFTGSLKQYVSSDSTNYSQKANANETANVINMVHDDGGGTVHAPN